MRDDMEKIMAVHDGERVGETLPESADKLSDDADTRDLLEKLARADQVFKDAADEMLELPVPSKLVDAIRESQPQPQSAEIIPFPRRKAVVSLAMAAGLAAVVATNTQLFQGSDDAVNGAGDGAYTTLLAQTLESVPSGEVSSSVDGSIQLMPSVTFQTADQGYCREYSAVRGAAEFSGVACRTTAGTWEVRAEQRLLPSTDGEDYRMAEGEDGASGLARDLDVARMLSYTEEDALITSGWQTSGR